MRSGTLSRAVLALLLTAGGQLLLAQVGPPPGAQPRTRPRASGTEQARPVLERLGQDRLRIGTIEIDTARKELTVPGTVNAVTTLEFVASTRNGLKAYESAMSLSTDAISFNTALLLIGMDPAHARLPTRHFDPVPPAGDPLQMWVSWKVGDQLRRVAVEELLYDQESKKPIPPAPWVYTGSAFQANGTYLAELDGVLIGFVHSPSPVIENVGTAGVNRYGSVILNPTLGLQPNTPITLQLKAGTHAAP